VFEYPGPLILLWIRLELVRIVERIRVVHEGRHAWRRALFRGALTLLGD
jgi:hypothetical protein